VIFSCSRKRVAFALIVLAQRSGAAFLPSAAAFFCGKDGIAQKPTGALIACNFLAFLVLTPLSLAAQQHFDGAKAYEYARQFVSIGPRWPTGPGHERAEEFLRTHFQREHDQFEEDTFTANTPIGPVPMRNFIVRFPGRKNGIIVLGTHYETNYPLRNIGFVGANDGAATTGLLMAIGDRLHEQTVGGKKLDGYSVWLVFFDG
jgi:hypothetical protein